MPDGIGNPGSVDLGAMSSIEVMRGPFSAMYGNSSGGVIQMFTDKAPATPEVSGDILFGSFNTRRESVQATGTKNGVEYLVNHSNYNSDGFRQQSVNDKRQATAKLGIKIAEDTKLTMLANWFDQFAQDPGGLRRTATPGTEPSAFLSPTGVSSGVITANTRVIRSNSQLGFNLEHKIDSSNTINVIAYAGHRENLQYLTTRASYIDRNFYGTDLRITNKGLMFEKPYQISYGINVGFMRDARKDSPASNGNISGSPTRNEYQYAETFDQYAQGIWSYSEKIDIHAGIRNTNLKLSIFDKIPAPDSTGNVNYKKVIPVFGLVFKSSPVLNFYANYGKGFETPTLIESTFSDTNGNGPNLALKPSTSTNIELGSKWLPTENTRINSALFNITTENEIVVKAAGDSTSYQNAGNTTRNGVEISAETKFLNNFSAYAAYTVLNATFDKDSSFNPGKNIPGTYRSQIYAELAWKYQPMNFQTAVEARYNSKVYVNDTNTDAAPDYAIYSIRGSFQQQQGSWKFTEYARIDNIFDQNYIGSVRVNDSFTRFFEPAPGRNWIMGVKANYMF
jgi:iron complex outermembrane receptor protein